MSHSDYATSLAIEIEALEKDWSFRAQVMALMRQADTGNLEALKAAFPDDFEELRARYNAPGGLLPGEEAEEAET
jgi:hypothetical protein